MFTLCLFRFSQGLRMRQIDMMADDIAGSSATLTKMSKKLRRVCVTAIEKFRRRRGQVIGGRREFVQIDESHFRHKRKVCFVFPPHLFPWQYRPILIHRWSTIGCLSTKKIMLGLQLWSLFTVIRVFALCFVLCSHPFCLLFLITSIQQYGRGRMAGGWKRKKWVFGMLSMRNDGRKKGKPILRLVETRSRRHLLPMITRHVRQGSSIVSDEWRAYRVLPALGYRHFTVNHSRWYVDPRTGAHTQNIERAWRTYKEQIWRLCGNRTESLLSEHLNVM